MSALEQPDLFSRAPESSKPAADGVALKAAGLTRVTANNAEFVARMREHAERIARERGSVHVDDLRYAASRLGIAPKSPNAWGAVFSERGKWVIVGYRASAWVTNRGHRSPIRQLIDELI